MKKEYDFSKGERGKFYSKDAIFNIPIYLKPEMMAFIGKLAKRKKKDISTIVNELLKTDREILEFIDG
jgi:hypothetical protein